MLNICYSSPASSKYLFIFLFSFIFPLWSIGTAKSYKCLSVAFLFIRLLLLLFFVCMCVLIRTRSGRLAEIRWSVCILKPHRIMCISFSRTDSGLCIYHMFVWSNLNLLHNSQLITFPTQSYLVSYSFCANLLHSLIMWLIVSSLSPHSLHLLFRCVLSIFALT